MIPHDKLTGRVHAILDYAKDEAQRWESEFIGTEHLLIGIVIEHDGIAGKVLTNWKVDQKAVREEILKINQGSIKAAPPRKNLPYSPRTIHVFDLAQESACRLGNDLIATEHVLLGLIREKEGVAAQILTNLGLKLDEIRDMVLEMIGAPVEMPTKSPHFVSASCQGRKCDICGLPSAHKVGEEIPHDDPFPNRHNLTAYVCCAHFIEIMGPSMTGPCRG